jgi:hypothetical protein
MPRLQIDLQEAFLNDLVVIRINDSEVCRGEFRTRFQTGRAHTLQVDVPTGKVDYVIELPEKRLSVKGELDVANDLFLGVTLSEEAQIAVRVSTEPFRYM